MGLLEFFKLSEKKICSIDLTDFKFLSDDHARVKNGRPASANNKGAWRGIRVKTSDNNTFFVTTYNMDGENPVWEDNIQMAEKRMKLVKDTNDEITLRGFGTDEMGESFADYGLTLHKSNNTVDKIILHMHDRNVDIAYEKAATSSQFPDLENFNNFTQKWDSNMALHQKKQIAMQIDTMNNRGTNGYENEDLPRNSK